MERRRLGSSELEVSRLSLGSTSCGGSSGPSRPPCAAQLPYSLVQREWVEGPQMTAALRASGAGVVAAFAMAGGVLTGKYAAGGAGRVATELEDPRFTAAREYGRRLRALAQELGGSPAALALAFPLAHPDVATVLFGATSPAQGAENAAALKIDSGTLQRVLGL